jgi:sugar phosphate isomerase/epimerase
VKTLVIIACLSLSGNALYAQKPEIGIVQNLENDSLLRASGYRYLIESTAKYFSPIKVTDQQFQEKLSSIKKLKTPLFAINLFIPGELKVVGPTVDENAILAYTEKVLQRCKSADVKMITWGSGGSRRLPDGFDPIKAKEQFIYIARKIATQAAQYDVTLALENLNSTETNFITTLQQALDIVKQVDHPNLRLCADIYHMLKENEDPAIIDKGKGYIVHCEIAEKEKRTPPGTMGDDFRPYLRALKKINYTGKIILECRWENLALQAPLAFQEIEKQIDDEYNKKK